MIGSTNQFDHLIEAIKSLCDLVEEQDGSTSDSHTTSSLTPSPQSSPDHQASPEASNRGAPADEPPTAA